MRGFAAIAIDSPKSEANVGGALRAAHCYGAALIVLRAPRFHRLPTNTMATERHVPVIVRDDVFDALPYDCVPVAIEFMDDARSLVDYVHPERAFYIFGPEDGSLGQRILGRCRDVVMVPTVFCMNLASTVNVVLYDRMVKRSKP